MHRKSTVEINCQFILDTRTVQYRYVVFVLLSKQIPHQICFSNKTQGYSITIYLDLNCKIIDNNIDRSIGPVLSYCNRNNYIDTLAKTRRINRELLSKRAETLWFIADRSPSAVAAAAVLSVLINRSVVLSFADQSDWDWSAEVLSFADRFSAVVVAAAHKIQPWSVK